MLPVGKRARHVLLKSEEVTAAGSRFHKLWRDLNCPCEVGKCQRQFPAILMRDTAAKVSRGKRRRVIESDRVGANRELELSVSCEFVTEFEVRSCRRLGRLGVQIGGGCHDEDPKKTAQNGHFSHILSSLSTRSTPIRSKLI